MIESTNHEEATPSFQPKTYKGLAYVLIVFGILGLIEIATRSLELWGNEFDVGIVSMGCLFLFQYLFGQQVAVSLFSIIHPLLGFSWIWIVFGYLVYKKLKVAEDPSKENLKKYAKVKKVIKFFVIAIIIFTFIGVLASMFNI